MIRHPWQTDYDVGLLDGMEAAEQDIRALQGRVERAEARASRRYRLIWYAITAAAWAYLSLVWFAGPLRTAILGLAFHSLYAAIVLLNRRKETQ
jgi:asparagine N-glycosylation enzyme membrane subunit Stt3